MYYYPSHYEARNIHPTDYLSHLYDTRPRVVSTRYYLGTPYISSYSDGHFNLLRRTPIRVTSDERELSPVRTVRATSIPPRAYSPEREVLPSRRTRATSVPPPPTEPVSFIPSLSRFTPKISTGTTPASQTYSYYSRLPKEPGDKMADGPKRMYSANPITFGPRIYTSLSVFPTMKYSSYNLMAPIERYRYRTSPKKTYSSPNPTSYPSSTSYYSYPTPTASTSRAYRQSDLYPTRFQINRVTSPTMDKFYAGRRTLY